MLKRQGTVRAGKIVTLIAPPGSQIGLGTIEDRRAVPSSMHA